MPLLHHRRRLGLLLKLFLLLVVLWLLRQTWNAPRRRASTLQAFYTFRARPAAHPTDMLVALYIVTSIMSVANAMSSLSGQCGIKLTPWSTKWVEIMTKCYFLEWHLMFWVLEMNNIKNIDSFEDNFSNYPLLFECFWSHIGVITNQKLCFGKMPARSSINIANFFCLYKCVRKKLRT